MKTEQVHTLLSLSLVAALVVTLLADDTSQQEMEAIWEAIHQALTPASNMRITCVYEPVDLQVFHLEGVHPTETYTTREYTVTISGIRSRIEELNKTYESRNAPTPFQITHNIHVFDGTQQRRLRTPIKGGEPGWPLQGWQFLEDRNSYFLMKTLYGCRVDFANKPKLRERRFESVKANLPGIYLLTAFNADDTRYQFTLDANRGFNVVKIEWLRPDDSTIEEVNFKLKQYHGEIWYPSEYEVIVDTPDKGHVIDRRIKITNAEFNIDIPEEIFKLEFPHGTKVWDGILEDWFVVGAAEELTLDADKLTGAPETPATDEQAVETVAQQNAPPVPSASATSQAKVQESRTDEDTAAENLISNAGFPWLLLAAPSLIVLVILFYILIFRARRA